MCLSATRLGFLIMRLGGSTSKRNSYHFLLMEGANYTRMKRTYSHWTQSVVRMAEQLAVPKR
jgi:hypothetical protein